MRHCRASRETVYLSRMRPAKGRQSRGKTGLFQEGQILIRFTDKKLDRNEPCWCGSGKKYKNCHMDFDEKIHEFEMQGAEVPDRSLIKTPAQIQGIRESAKINIAVLDEIAEKIHEGMTTQEIDDIVYNTTVKMGGIPADLHYEGYPKSVCTSINEQVCHGIPSDKVVLREGDIVKEEARPGHQRVRGHRHPHGEAVDIPRRHGQCGASARPGEWIQRGEGDRRTRLRSGIP